MAFEKPHQDDTMVPKAPLPLPLPPSQRAPPPCTGEENPYSSSQIEELEPNRTLPDMEADATLNKLQVQERRTKSRNEGPPHRRSRHCALSSIYKARSLESGIVLYRFRTEVHRFQSCITILKRNCSNSYYTLYIFCTSGHIAQLFSYTPREA